MSIWITSSNSTAQCQSYIVYHLLVHISLNPSPFLLPTKQKTKTCCIIRKWTKKSNHHHTLTQQSQTSSLWLSVWQPGHSKGQHMDCHICTSLGDQLVTQIQAYYKYSLAATCKWGTSWGLVEKGVYFHKFYSCLGRLLLLRGLPKFTQLIHTPSKRNEMEGAGMLTLKHCI